MTRGLTFIHQFLCKEPRKKLIHSTSTGSTLRNGIEIVLSSTVWSRLTDRKYFCIQCLPEELTRWKEPRRWSPDFERRKEQLLADCQVPPTLFRGVMQPAGVLRPTVRRLAAQPREPDSTPAPTSPACSPTSSARTPSPSPTARPGTPGLAEVHRPARLGPRAADRRIGPPGRPRELAARRRAGLRPLGLPQEGDRVGGRAAAVVRPAGQDRQLPGRHLPGLRQPTRARPGRCPAVPAQGVGQGPEAAARRPACPRTSASARGTNWPWRCWTSAARCCRTPGFPATTRWAGCSWFRQRIGGRGTSAICWRCRRTRRCATWRPQPPPYGGRGRGPRRRSAAWSAGARRCRRRPGRRSRSATARKGRWWWRSCRGAGAGEGERPGRRTWRRCWWCSASDKAAASWKHDYLLSNAAPDDAAGGVRAGVQGGAPDRGVPEAGQGRGGLGRLPGADLAGLASSSGVVVAGDLVPDAGDPAGKKDGPRR